MDCPEEGTISRLSSFMALPADLSSFLGSGMFFYVSFYLFLKTLFLSWWILLHCLVFDIPQFFNQTTQKSSAKISNLSQALFYVKLKKRWRSPFQCSLTHPTAFDKGGTPPNIIMLSQDLLHCAPEHRAKPWAFLIGLMTKCSLKQVSLTLLETPGQSLQCKLFVQYKFDQKVQKLL